MTYEIAKLAFSQEYAVRYFTDIRDVKVTDRLLLSRSSTAAVNEDISILIRHYLAGILKHDYDPKMEWVSFKDIRGTHS